MNRLTKSKLVLLQFIILVSCLAFPMTGYGGYADECTDANTLKPDISGKPLEIKGGEVKCIGAGTYNYSLVNIHGTIDKDGNTVAEGKLIFKNVKIDFWAKSILVENGGSLIIGSETEPIANAVTIYLYGKETDAGADSVITCKTTGDGADPDLICGVPRNRWAKGNATEDTLPSGIKDYFYQYNKLPTDDDLGERAYFGRKALAVSYGGTLRMFGKKGATSAKMLEHLKIARLKKPVKKGDKHVELNKFVDWKAGMRIGLMPKDGAHGPSGFYTIKEAHAESSDYHTSITIKESGVHFKPDSGKEYVAVAMDPSSTSWARLDGDIDMKSRTLNVDREIDWQDGDKIVVTTTDYLPSHSEELTIDTNGVADKKRITFKEDIKYPHRGTKYSLKDHNIPSRLRDKGFTIEEVETRAAVALLTRNIQIVSAGDNYGDKFPGDGYFGGHTIIRQGFKQFQAQGVEFRRLGQGGRMAHAPVNFHLTREVPAGTFVRDCSINESMAHWIELRGTQKVVLERNVGWKSIGHGYYLSDGTEAENVLVANIGIHTRAAVDSDQNPRRVPGVMAMTSKETPPPGAQFQQYESDYMHPSVFQIMNAWNTFDHNMAVGAGTCGACYWIVPARTGGLSSDMHWSGYAGIQDPGAKRDQPYGKAPLKSFYGNFCSTAQYSLLTIGGPAVCSGVVMDFHDENKNYKLQPVQNKFAQGYFDQKPSLYPDTSNFANYNAALCSDKEGKDCAMSVCYQGNTDNCPVSVIDSYTSSFHWAQQNFAAIWLRSNWFLVTDSALTDVLNGGLTMVSGGSYDQVINGYWALTRNSVFIGNTQPWDPSLKNPGNAYASPAGPFNTYPNGLSCLSSPDRGYCLSKAEGIAMPIDTFGVYQRLYNIYDGPVYQENNAFLQIKKLPVDNCGDGKCNSQYMYGSGNRALSIPKSKEEPYKDKCILPNAAIGWKQPNGFYYPPAFHSRNLYFDKVDLRHYIIVPLFKPGTADVYEPWIDRDYCYYPGVKSELFAKDFTDVDRQTELNDDDGSLSGLAGARNLPYTDFEGTIAVNKDMFFLAPTMTMECGSDQTCFQAPYDYVTAVVYPNQFKEGPLVPNYCEDNTWCNSCDQRNCYGVPMYRQYYTAEEEKGGKKKDPGQSVRMMGAGIWQRSTLVANLGKYYIDTAVSSKTQIKETPLYGAPDKIFHNLSVFEKNKSYNFFLLYAKPSTRLTFQIYVGKDSTFSETGSVRMVRAGTKVKDGDNEVVILRGNKLNFTSADFWPSNWSRAYNSDKGILEVTMDMGFSRAQDEKTKKLADDFGDKAKQETCKPKSFCRWDDKKNKCCAAGNLTECDESVCSWSNKALDCPSGGCLGFQVTFPDKFSADDDAGGANRPNTEPYPVKDWNVGWKYADKIYDGDLKSCSYSDTNKPEQVTPDLWKE